MTPDATRPFDSLDAAQLAARGDMEPEAFRTAAHAVADLMADYLARVKGYSVVPPVEPGELRGLFAPDAPSAPEPLGAILDDYRTLVEPNVTHWQHPGFFAYFSSSASAPGILGEMLMATLVSNAMLWQTSPVATELEEVTVAWLRDALGLPASFDGLFTDTASTSTLTALAAAREASGHDVAADGLAGTRMRVYASSHAHSSIDKAAMTLGLGRVGVRHIDADERFQMRPEVLADAITKDRAAGWTPIAVVATLGTTSTTSVDPLAPVADVAERERLWLHVDAAYAGVVALIPERRDAFAGWERADSIVVNPHKWLFTPLDCSLLLTRRPEQLRAAFSVVPAYLKDLGDRPVHDYHEYTPQLGRRFRALKMWFLMRYFGVDGLRARIEEHIEMAQEFAAWVDAERDAERMAPAPFSTVCFRWRPERYAGRDQEPEVATLLDELNAALLARLNGTGEVFLSSTRLGERLVLRLAIGNIRTERRHVAQAWRLIRELGAEIAAGRPSVDAGGDAR